MSRELMLPSPQLSRRTSLSSDIDSTLPPPRTQNKPRFGEVAGGAAAECAAVCCCCPFTLMNLLILAVYKVPAGVCRKAWAMKKERQRLENKKKQGVLLLHKPIGPIGLTREELEMEVKRVKEGAKEEEKINNGGGGGDTNDDDEASKKVDLLETEMWSQFNGTGFFRSQSQRE